MAKRRTKKQKKNAKHQFTVSWEPEAKKGSDKTGVKGQNNNNKKNPASKQRRHNYPVSKEKNYSLASIKKDIVRSIVLASLILASELVLYLVL